MTRVLVTDAWTRTSLNVIRSLGKKGIEITAADSQRISTAFFSKYTHDIFIYPSPEIDHKAFINSLLKKVNDDEYDMIIPTTDHTVVPLAIYKKEFLPYCKIPLPDLEVLLSAVDKWKTLIIAKKNGIPIPKTFCPVSTDEIEQLKKEINYPVIIKSRIGFGSRGILYINRPSELEEGYLKIHKYHPFPMIQEFIPGDVKSSYGVSVLFNYNSEPKAYFCHRRLRSYPVSGGPSVLRESVFEPKMIEFALRLLHSMKWFGVAMVEFKIDSRDGMPKLMEVNPRFWGSLKLAIDSGVDFPYLLYRLIMKGDVHPVTDYKVGTKCRFLPGDLLHFLKSPNKLKLLPEFLKFYSKDLSYDVLSLDDFKPMIGQMAMLILGMLKPENRKEFIERRASKKYEYEKLIQDVLPKSDMAYRAGNNG